MPRLIDGTEVSSDAEAWRHQCEADHILNLPTLGTRREWLEKIERRRGKASADQLRQTIQALWESNKSKAAQATNNNGAPP